MASTMLHGRDNWISYILSIVLLIEEIYVELYIELTIEIEMKKIEIKIR